MLRRKAWEFESPHPHHIQFFRQNSHKPLLEGRFGEFDKCSVQVHQWLTFLLAGVPDCRFAERAGRPSRDRTGGSAADKSANGAVPVFALNILHFAPRKTAHTGDAKGLWRCDGPLSHPFRWS